MSPAPAATLPTTASTRPARPSRHSGLHPSLGPKHLVIASSVVLVAILVGGTVTAGADPTSAAPSPSCPELAARYAPDLPPGWVLECRAALPQGWPVGEAGASAMSSRRERRIVVVEGQEPAYAEASIAHEIAHAESSTWPAELKVAFANAVGAESWTGAGGPASPAEVFAESSVRCRGLGTHVSYPLVPCAVVEAARTAGGSAGPLPVTGPEPTS